MRCVDQAGLERRDPPASALSAGIEGACHRLQQENCLRSKVLVGVLRMTVNTAVWLVSSPLPEIPFDKVLLPGGGLAELSREVVKTAPIPSGAVSLAFPNFELFFFFFKFWR